MKRFLCVAVLVILISGCQTVDDFVGSGPITLSSNVSNHYQNKYLKGVGPQYYVVSADGRHSRYVYCSAGPGQCTFGLVVLDSITKCEKRARQKCYIFAEGEDVIWKGPVTYGGSQQSLSSTPNDELKNQDLCNYAIEYKIVAHRVIPIWDAVRDTYVADAKRRGLTPEACSIEVSKDTRLSWRLSALSPDKVCGVALNGLQWKTSDYARDYVSEATNRGLTPLDCGKAISRIDEAKLAEASDRLVCDAALHKHPTADAFSTRRSKRDIVAEAKSRNLTPVKCRALVD